MRLLLLLPTLLGLAAGPSIVAGPARDHPSPPPQAGTPPGTRPPSPTGRSSREQMPAADPRSIAAAQSIRRALDTNEDFAQAAVVVTPGMNRVTIQGTVADEDQKSALIRAVDKAANKSNLDFNLTVRQR